MCNKNKSNNLLKTVTVILKAIGSHHAVVKNTRQNALIVRNSSVLEPKRVKNL